MNHLALYNTQYHGNLLLNTFHLNGQFLGFQPQANSKVKTTLHSVIKRVKQLGKYCSVAFIQQYKLKRY